VADAANNARRHRAPWGLRSRVARAGGRRRLRNSLCVALHPQRTGAPARGYANDGPRNCDRRQWANAAVIGDGHCVALPCRHECLCGDDTNIQTVVLSGNPKSCPHLISQQRRESVAWATARGLLLALHSVRRCPVAPGDTARQWDVMLVRGPLSTASRLRRAAQQHACSTITVTSRAVAPHHTRHNTVPK
jgi:hypothetical protein